MLLVVATAPSSWQTNICRPSTEFWIGSAPRRAIGGFFLHDAGVCPVTPYGRFCVTVRVGLLASSQSGRGSSYDRLPNGQRPGADWGPRLAATAAHSLQRSSCSHVAQEPRVTSPLVLRTTAQEKGRLDHKNGNSIYEPPFLSLAAAHESPINLLHARVRLLDLQPRPLGLASRAVPGFRVSGWEGGGKIATQNRLLKGAPSATF